MRKTMLAIALAAFAPTFTPQQADAQACTDGYAMCLNDHWDAKGWEQAVKDMQCFGEYLRCIAVE